MTQVQQSEGLNVYQPEATDGALKLRLNSDRTLEKIEMYLNGEEYRYDENGRLIKVQVVGCEKANIRGVRGIMSIVSGYISPDTVQGNLEAEEIGHLMNMFKENMGYILASNSSEWGVDRNERRSIINFIEPLIRMFISRTKDNKERDSYGMRTVETGKVIDKSSKWDINPFHKN